MTRNPLRILVTGAGGLLGSELSGALAERGHAVVAMRRIYGAPGGFDDLGLSWTPKMRQLAKVEPCP
jgi:uncharacterized protein YbjT (DUF2867 family)